MVVVDTGAGSLLDSLVVVSSFGRPTTRGALVGGVEGAAVAGDESLDTQGALK